MNKILLGYINQNGAKFENIRNIHFDCKGDLVGNLGIFKVETQYEPNAFITSSFKMHEGVYIYQTDYDFKKALRIYKDFADYQYTFHDDYKLISILQDRQSFVTLTDFPTGIVTIENKVIGQEIPYYDQYITLEAMI